MAKFVGNHMREEIMKGWVIGFYSQKNSLSATHWELRASNRVNFDLF